MNKLLRQVTLTRVLFFLVFCVVLWASGIAPAAYNLIQNAGVSLTGRSILNFINGGCVDNPGSLRTDCTIGGTLYSQTNSVTDAVQTTETSLFGTGSGSNILPANFYAIGTALKFQASGFYSDTAVPGTLTINLKHSGGLTGTVVLGTTGAIPLPVSASVTNGAWRLIATITCRTTGTAGTLIVNTNFERGSSTGLLSNQNSPSGIVNTTAVTVDTTAAQTVDLTAAWSAAGQTITSTNIDMALPGGGSASNGVTITIANAGVTGTTVNTLTKLTGAPSTALIAATTDTGGIVGVASSGAGTTGTATLTISGQTSCVFDGATTAGHYVQISATVAGNCHDTASTYPTTGQVIGRVLSTNGGGGTYGLDIFPSEIKAGGAAGGGFIQTLTAPVSGSFTARNFNVGAGVTTTQTNATSPVTYITLLQHDPSNTLNMAALSKNIIAATYTVTVGLSLAISGVGNQAIAGLWLSDGGAGPNNLFFSFQNGIGIRIPIFSNFSTFAGDAIATFSLDVPTAPLAWLRIQETASNRIYSVSSDGANFAQVFTEAVGAHFTTAQYGIAVENRGGSATNPDVMMTWYSFTESNP